MRRRRSASSASGAWKEKGRISSLVAIFESPWFEAWPCASPAGATSAGSRLTAPAIADAERTARRVAGNDRGHDYSPSQGELGRRSVSLAGLPLGAETS